MATLGMITIGQSPRDDVVRTMFGAQPPARIVEHGALDSLDSTAIHELLPREGEHPLVTRLRDGSEVYVAKERLMPFMQRAVDDAIAGGASMVVILCSGDFSKLHGSVPLIYPDRVATSAINAVMPSGQVGVMMPHAGQYESMRRKWGHNDREFIGVTVSPYSGTGELEGQARQLAESGADIIVMDCMGFTTEMKQTVAEAAGVPTVLVNRLVGRVIEEMVSI